MSHCRKHALKGKLQKKLCSNKSATNVEIFLPTQKAEVSHNKVLGRAFLFGNQKLRWGKFPFLWSLQLSSQSFHLLIIHFSIATFLQARSWGGVERLQLSSFQYFSSLTPPSMIVHCYHCHLFTGKQLRRGRGVVAIAGPEWNLGGRAVEHLWCRWKSQWQPYRGQFTYYVSQLWGF